MADIILDLEEESQEGRGSLHKQVLDKGLMRTTLFVLFIVEA